MPKNDYGISPIARFCLYNSLPDLLFNRLIKHTETPAMEDDDTTNFLKEYGRTPCTYEIWERLKVPLFRERISRHDSPGKDNIYKPFGDQFAFRVLFLENSGDKAGELRGTFIYQEPEDLVPYDYLSYTWGSPATDKYISIDGLKLPITSNLNSALREIRSRPDARMVGVPIWVDSICINQQDVSERNHQVRQMGKIYSEAEKVIVYLGAEADGSEKVPQLFSMVTAAEKSHPYHFERARETDSVQNQTRTGLFEERGLPPIGDELWEALHLFMARPWFHRAWVVQEAALAKKILYVCGEWAVPNDLLPSLLELSVPYLERSFKGRHTMFGDACQKHFRLMPYFRGKYSEKENLRVLAEQKISLPELVLSLDFAGASDPRDFVYAFLSLAPEGEMMDLQPKYDEPAVNTFVDFARLGIESGNGVYILYGACVCEGAPGVPSWVPNWEKRKMLPCLTTPNRYSGGHRYISAGGTSSDISLVDSERIRARSVKIGAIQELADYPHMTPAKTTDDLIWIQVGPNQDDRIQRFRLTTFILMAIGQFLAAPNSPYGSNEQPEDPEDVLWRTALVNFKTANSQDEAGEEELLSFMSYVIVTAYVESEKREQIHATQGEARFAELRNIGVDLSNGPTPDIIIEEVRDSLHLIEARASNFFHDVGSASACMRPCLLKNGYVGQVPYEAEVGDEVFVIAGAPTPFVLRPVHSEEGTRAFRLIGSCYVHGLMKGEVLDMPQFSTEDVAII